jgi:hypothetical protein
MLAVRDIALRSMSTAATHSRDAYPLIFLRQFCKLHLRWEMWVIFASRIKILGKYSNSHSGAINAAPAGTPDLMRRVTRRLSEALGAHNRDAVIDR